MEGLAAVLALAARPVSRARLVEETGEGTIERLLELGLIQPCAAPVPETPLAAPQRRCGRVVIGLCGAISVTERTGYIARVRALARLCAQRYLSDREAKGFPLLKKAAAPHPKIPLLTS